MTRASRIRYRELRRAEAHRLGSVDRAERIDGVYRAVGGALGLEPRREDVVGWDALELAAYVLRLQDLLDAGGVAFGAFDGPRLVGLASLDRRPVGGDPAVMKLDMLYVSAARRGSGIGRRLTALVCARARSLGAAALYVSATPTRRTVDFYRGLGAEPLARPDPALLALEPDDVHLLLRGAPS